MNIASQVDRQRYPLLTALSRGQPVVLCPWRSASENSYRVSSVSTPPRLELRALSSYEAQPLWLSGGSVPAHHCAFADDHLLWLVFISRNFVTTSLRIPGRPFISVRQADGQCRPNHSSRQPEQDACSTGYIQGDRSARHPASSRRNSWHASTRSSWPRHDRHPGRSRRGCCGRHHGGQCAGRWPVF